MNDLRKCTLQISNFICGLGFQKKKMQTGYVAYNVSNITMLEKLICLYLQKYLFCVFREGSHRV